MAAAPQKHGRGEEGSEQYVYSRCFRDSRNRRGRNIRFAVGESVDGKGEQVCIFVLRPDLIDSALTSMLPKEVRVEAARIIGLPALLKLDGILFDLGVRISLVRSVQTWLLQGFLRKVGAT